VNVSADAIAKVPVENLRVSRAEFGALWAWAEHMGGRSGPDDDFLIGILRTCRWLAGQPVSSAVIGRAEMPPAPLTLRRYSAMPETIDAEYLTAVAACRPRVSRPGSRPDLARGVAVTLAWTWHGSRQPPLDLSPAAAG
jgi:hypothetical protein